MNKDEQRANVLRFYYDFNEKHPGDVQQTAAAVNATGLDPAAVLEAQQYLVDKGFLQSETRQQIRALGQGLIAMFARISNRGIDFVEDPEGWKGSEVPAALVSIISHGNVSGVTVAGRDQQNVRGDVSGVVTQGNASISISPFPIENLRRMLAQEPEALAAVEEINSEVTSKAPRWGKVIGSFETFNGAVAVGEAAHTVMTWLAQPGVPEFVQHAVRAITGS